MDNPASNHCAEALAGVPQSAKNAIRAVSFLRVTRLLITVTAEVGGAIPLDRKRVKSDELCGGAKSPMHSPRTLALEGVF